MLKRHWHSIIFFITLVALSALGLWWFLFFQRAIRFERQATLNALQSATTMTALKLGHSVQPQKIGPFADGSLLELVPLAQAKQGPMYASLRPMHPELAVRPRHEAFDKLETRMHRRWLMVVGEGGFLLFLLLMTTGMLSYMLRLERREGRRLKDFISTVTHEMKTPLAGIKSMLQTSAAGRIPPEQMPELTAMALREAARLERLIENVLVSGRMRSQTLQVRAQVQPLWPVLDRFVALRSQVLMDEKQSLELIAGEALEQVDPKQAQAWFDVDALRIVLDNLVDNAFHYSDQKPFVKLIVQPKFGPSKTGVVKSGQWQIIVTDQGRGFKPKNAEQLFTPFIRGEDLDSALSKGTGLGLSIARRLARAMQGDLHAESAGLGCGSRFIVTLQKEAQ